MPCIWKGIYIQNDGNTCLIKIPLKWTGFNLKYDIYVFIEKTKKSTSRIQINL